ncbi:MAG TPA: hypothetical protein VG838_02195 [Opitutaceae bacterium]|nr:hypothetical protein [Opitutaceae bacterium]
MSSLHRLRSLSRLSLPPLLLLVLAACASDRRSPPPPPPTTAPAEAAIPEMEAQGTLLAGRLKAEVVLNRAGFAGRPRAAGDTGDGPPGAGGGGRRGGGGGRGGGRGRGGGNAPVAAEDKSDSDASLHVRASTLPPVRLHLRLTNLGSAPIEVEVTDFDSELGNFVVQPDKIPLPSGESVEAEPMTSRLGLTSSEIPLTVGVRVGEQSDHQVLTLRVVPSPAAVPPTTPETPATPVAP